jgi:hypothetical protein
MRNLFISLSLLSMIGCGGASQSLKTFGLKGDAGQGEARLTGDLEPLSETPAAGEPLDGGDEIVVEPAEGDVNSPENQSPPESLPMYLDPLLPKVHRIYQVSEIQKVGESWEFFMGHINPEAVRVILTAASDREINVRFLKMGEEIWSGVLPLELTNDESYDISMFHNFQIDVWRQLAFHIWPISYPNEPL